MNFRLSLPCLLAADTPNAFQVWLAANWWAAVIIIVLASAVGVMGYLIYKWKVPTAPARLSEKTFRHLVAKTVLMSAIWGTVVLAGLAVLMPKDNSAKDVLSIVLPLFGTWVGTLLAYYFGKDNYKSAAKNSEKLAKAMNATDKLKEIPVTQPGLMIPIAKIELPPVVQGKRIAEFNTILLKDLRDQMKQQRMPLIGPDTGAPYAVIHKSLITDFLVKQGLIAAANLDTTTLKQLLDDPDAGKVAKNSFVVVPNTASLADVKERMTQQSQQAGVNCEDAFITTPGTSKVEGWITNDIIAANAMAVTADGKTT